MTGHALGLQFQQKLFALAIVNVCPMGYPRAAKEQQGKRSDGDGKITPHHRGAFSARNVYPTPRTV
jgi:hypothetical protein